MLALGFSTHNEAQLRAAAAEPADYLALGPIFGTSPRPTPILLWAGWIAPAAAVDRASAGGDWRNHAANARAVLDSGADSVAVIGDLFPEDGDIAGRIREWIKIR